MFELRTGSRVHQYTKMDDGTFRKVGEESVSIPLSAFSSSVRGGYVFIYGDQPMGTIIRGDDGYYYKRIGTEGGQMVWARTDGSGLAASMMRYVGDPAGRINNDVSLTHIGPAFDLLEKMEGLLLAERRLDQIMSSGEVPSEVEYLVTVTAKGSVTVKQTPAQAKRLIGGDVTVESVAEATVVYTKTIEVPKSSRWGCACDLVVAEDLAAPGQVTSWEVVSCAPVEGESEVHAAA